MAINIARTSLKILHLKDITTYLVNNTFPRLEFEELCTGIGK